MKIFFRTICLLFIAGLVSDGIIFRHDAAAAYPIALEQNGGANDNRHNLSMLATHTGVKASDSNDPNSYRICVFCHTPHGASAQSTLWNRLDPATADFPIYGRPDEIFIDDIADAQYNSAVYPNGASRMCLSCHDGASAIGDMLTETITINMTFGYTMNDWVNDGGSNTMVIDLSRSHPISFVYDENVRSQVQSGHDGLGDGFSYVLNGPYLDGQNRMQCTSCHDPHLDTNNGSTYTLPFWRDYVGTNENTDYESTCQTCHQNGSSGTNRGAGTGGDHNL